MPQTYRERRYLPTLHRLQLQDFSGGLNLNDSPLELSDSETPDCMNVSTDERGGIAKRLGYRRTSSSALPWTPLSLFFWGADPAGAAWYVYGSSIASDGKVYRSPNGSVWTLVHSYASPAGNYQVKFADFNGKLVILNAGIGVSTWDGTTWVDVAGSAKGETLAVWQNKVFVADCGINPATAARIRWCAASDITTWDAADYVDVWEKDTLKLTALYPTEAALYAFKEESAYRIYDSSTGAYSMTDAGAGAGGPHAITSAGGTLYVLNKQGVFESRGGALQKISGSLDPLFNSLAEGPDWAVGPYQAVATFFRGRLFFSLNSATFVDPLKPQWSDVTLECQPGGTGWTMHSFGMGVAAVDANRQHLFGVVRAQGASTLPLYVHAIFAGGTDDALGDGSGGTPISCWWQTRPLELTSGWKVRLRQVIVQGRGTWTLTTRVDGATTDTNTRTVVCASSTHASYAPSLWSFGSGREFAIRVAQTGGGTVTTTDAPVGRVVGEVALNGLRLGFFPLGVT